MTKTEFDFHQQQIVGKEKNTKRSPYSFFFIMGLVGVFAVLIGFAKTFFIPVSAGTFNAPLAVHLHGAFAFAWIVFFFIQTFLIQRKNFKIHKALGLPGLLIALGAAITMFPAGMHQIERDLQSGLGESAISSILGIFTSALMFTILVIAGIIYRRRLASHKRLMLLATIIVLWPAWFRFRHYFPMVPRPDIWFGVVLADSLIVISWLRDKIVTGKVHPVLLYGGLFIIIENTIESFTFDNPSWRFLAKQIYAFLQSP